MLIISGSLSRSNLRNQNETDSGNKESVFPLRDKILKLQKVKAGNLAPNFLD